MYTKNINDATREAIREAIPESIDKIVNPILQDMALVFDEKMSESFSPDITDRAAFEANAVIEVVEGFYNKYRHLSTKYRNLQIQEAALHIDEE